jgi:holo-[acyl-carrier protein] synthase
VTPPAVLGVGIDAVDVGRFAAILDRRPAMRERLFSEGERAYAATLRNPVPSLAARFAVKEATMKALGVGVGAFDWVDVEVVRAPGGRPSLVVGGRAEVLAQAAGVGGWQVSLTHTDLIATAVVLALPA